MSNSRSGLLSAAFAFPSDLGGIPEETREEEVRLDLFIPSLLPPSLTQQQMGRNLPSDTERPAPRGSAATRSSNATGKKHF
ncbi:hypothetical protein XENTR_v10004238 [Xenopus tropicalis]|nr:hypothetical protein XENTR_v10004238 [Xenopus tropicalis]